MAKNNTNNRDIKEILKKVRLIDIKTRRIVNDVFAGEYHSVFKGRGMEFDSVREYQFGDDVRTIDWNVTARSDKAFVKVFEEERELTVMILADLSPSGYFGTTGMMKRQLIAELTALLAFSASQNNDRVGLVIFTDEVEKVVPPQKGRDHILRIIRDILYFEPSGKETNISVAIGYLLKLLKRPAITFLISDFLDSGFEKNLRIASRKHDLVPILLRDPRELELASVGLMTLYDAETGEEIIVDTEDPGLLNQYRENAKINLGKTAQFFASLGIDYIEVQTGRSYVNPVANFFRKKAGRY